jgi:hypothetical protein
VIRRTYSGDAGPLAEVLIMLYERSLERRRRQAEPPAEIDEVNGRHNRPEI